MHPDLTLLGPAEAPLTKIHDRYRWHLLLKAPSSRTLHACLTAVLAAAHQERQHLRGVRLHTDIDPLTFL
jgi:primosomal protein N' (replication factor Y)